jgi:tRNA-dihydrouridine synthase A
MRAEVSVPVTVKTRLGVDDDDNYEFLHRFADTVVAAGCRTLIVHARKAWLSGLSPKQNREVPPLDYGRVHRLKRDFPQIEIVINGGLMDAEAVKAELAQVDGVMLGRAAYHEPMLLAELDRILFGSRAHLAARRDEALHAYCQYVETELRAGTPLKAMTRHLLGIYSRERGGRKWRRALSGLVDGTVGLAELRALIDADAERGCGRLSAPAAIAAPMLQTM